MSNSIINDELTDLLANGLKELALAISVQQQEKLLEYVGLLCKWNKTYNLTAVREPEKMIGLHILDSLAVLPYLNAVNILDVGTGGGLPGIPLAIARADSSVTMLDSLQKKTKLGLKNAWVVCERVEHYQPSAKFDLVISRAFAELSAFINSAAHTVVDSGRFFAMKGVYPHDEIARLPATHKVEQVIELSVPQIEGKRHLVVLKKA